MFNDIRLAVLLLIAFNGIALAQTQTHWDCPPSAPKLGRFRVRVSDGVTNRLAEHKMLPDISDLIGKKLNSLVVIGVLVAENGDVSCSRLEAGDPTLYDRSQRAAMAWHFKPYELNGQFVTLETRIEFQFKKNRVEVVVPSR